MTVTRGMKSWGWPRRCCLLPGAGFTGEARHMSCSHRCYFSALLSLFLPGWGGDLHPLPGSSSELRRGGCTGGPSAEGNCPVGSHRSPLPFAERRD